VLSGARTGARLGPAFPLVPRGRVSGRPLGSLPGLRRGGRFDPVSSRPYVAGDDPRLIDQRASARLATARASDDLVVREHLAELSPPVLLVRDRSASMQLYPAGTPWLHKPAAVESVALLVQASARRARSAFAGVEGTLADVVQASLPARGGFVFVVSDFLEPVEPAVWLEALARGLDVVPVVLQDPVWERTFPDVAGVVLTVADAAGARARPVRLTRREVEERRAGNEARFAALLRELARVGLAPVVVDRADVEHVHGRFLAWAAARGRRGRGC
jgi:uncharacterized protein (DUF58 family)